MVKAMRGRLGDGFGGVIGAGAGPVLNEEGLSEPLRQPLTHDTREDVERASWCSPDHDAHRPQRIGLRPSETRESRQRGNARGQMQKLSSMGKFHIGPLK